MRGAIRAAAIRLFAVACAAPTPSPSLSPTPVPSPEIICGDIGPTDCADAADAALAAIVALPAPVKLELGRGVFCPNPDLLFEMTTCLMAERDDGWTFIGHAVVTFAEGSSQAYVNVLKHGHEFGGEFITLATPQPSSSP